MEVETWMPWLSSSYLRAQVSGQLNAWSLLHKQQEISAFKNRVSYAEVKSVFWNSECAHNYHLGFQAK